MVKRLGKINLETQTLAAIKLSNMKKLTAGNETRIPDGMKTFRPGACQLLLEYPHFLSLCIASTIDCYVDATKDFKLQFVTSDY